MCCPRFIQRIRPLLLAVVLLTALQTACAAEDQADDAQRRVSRLCATMVKSTVRIISRDDRASGVIVSRDGHILTVAHGVPSGTETVRVRFASGDQMAARVLRRDEMIDAAVLQVDKLPDGIAVAERRTRSHTPEGALRVGKAVFSVGCPARLEDSAGPVVRLGRIIAVEPSLMRTSAVVTVGDSGGPLFDSAGQLIAIHRQIGAGRLANIHTPIAKVFATAFPFIDTSTSSAASSDASTDDQPRKLAIDVCSSENSPHRFQSELRLSDGRTIPATFVQSDVVVAKASLMAAQAVTGVAVGEEEFVSPLEQHVQQQTDLVFCRVGRGDGPTDLPHSSAVDHQLVKCPVTECIGIVGRRAWDEARRPSRLGCRLSQSDNSLRVTNLSPNSAVTDAGMRIGDRLKRINGSSAATLKQLRDLLEPLQPGDWVAFDFLRGSAPMRSSGQLRHDTRTMLYRAEFLDGRSGPLSDRRTGFRNVLQHDLSLSPEQMGSPLLDRHGRLIAVNIARRAREAVLAIPLSTIDSRIKTLDWHEPPPSQ